MNKNIDKKKYKKALDFAYKIHFKQSRKGTGIPYFTHLVSVSNNIIEDGVPLMRLLEVYYMMLLRIKVD